MPKLTVPVGSKDHIQGNPKAPCTLVEYGDFQCLNCGAAYLLVKDLQRSFGDRLRFVFRNFPMTRLHAQAEAAAETAEFAATQGKYWETHDLLLENQLRLGDELFAELAQQLGMDAEKLREALDKHTFLSRVRDDFTSGVRSGVNGTPTFYINGERFNGPMDLDHMTRAMEDAIAG